MEVKQFTGIKPDTVAWWASYTQNLTFKSEQEARDWLFRRAEWADQQSHVAAFGGPDGTEYNRAMADAMPLYKSGKSFKIGKRIRKKPRGWEEFTIIPNTFETLTTAGYINGFDGPTVGKVQLVPISKIYKTEKHSEEPRGIEKVERLYDAIEESQKFKAIVLNDDGGIIDGHHRFEVAKRMKMKTVPAQYVTYDEEQ